MELPKNVWRFKNLEPGLSHIAAQVSEVLPQGSDWANQHSEWKEFIDTCWEGSQLLNACYAYGLPMRQLVEAIRWDSLFQTKRLYLEIENEEKYISDGELYMLPKASSSALLSQVGDSILISDGNLTQMAHRLMDDVEDTHDVTDEDFIPEHYEMVKRITHKCFDEDTKRLAHRVKDFKSSCYSEFICHIACLDETSFNDSLQAEVEEFIGSKEKRARKRRVVPQDIVRLRFVGSVAIALDVGLRFTYFDPAIPIWDFPIAQRPEIQKLLTPVMRERIPDPSVFESAT